MFPKGILGIRLLKNKPANKLMADISPEQTVEIINLTKKYVNDKISLDEKFINTLSKILKKKKTNEISSLINSSNLYNNLVNY